MVKQHNYFFFLGTMEKALGGDIGGHLHLVHFISLLVHD